MLVPFPNLKKLWKSFFYLQSSLFSVCYQARQACLHFMLLCLQYRKRLIGNVWGDCDWVKEKAVLEKAEKWSECRVVLFLDSSRMLSVTLAWIKLALHECTVKMYFRLRKKISFFMAVRATVYGPLRPTYVTCSFLKIVG